MRRELHLGLVQHSESADSSSVPQAVQLAARCLLLLVWLGRLLMLLLVMSLLTLVLLLPVQRASLMPLSVTLSSPLHLVQQG